MLVVNRQVCRSNKGVSPYKPGKSDLNTILREAEDDHNKEIVAIEAAVFDFDGLIMDTENAWYEALFETFGEHGAVLPLEKWTLCVGANHDVFDPYDYLEEMLKTKIDRAALKAKSGCGRTCFW